MQLLPPIYWIIIIGISAIIGYYFTFLLFTQKKGNRKANLFLAGFTFAVSYFLTLRVIIFSGFYREFPYLLGTGLPVWYLTGPFFYFYVKLHLLTDYKLRLSDLLHYLPFLIIVLLMFDIIIKSGNEKIYLVNNRPDNLAITFPINFLPYIILIGYFILSIRLITKFQGSYKSFFSNTNIDHLEWIKRLVTVYVLYLIFDVMASLSTRLFNTPFFQLHFMTLFAMSLFIHFVAYYSFKYPARIFYVKSEELKKYQTSNLTEEAMDSYLEQLNKIMKEEKLYLNNNLSLIDLANKLELKPYQVSQIINQKYNSNFYDYINRFRVKEAKERLADPNFTHLSILGIGLDVGFNSKTSFSNNFKKFEKTTPSAFRKNA